MVKPVGSKESFSPESQLEPRSSASQGMGAYMQTEPFASREITTSSLPDSSQVYRRGREVSPAAPAAVVERGFNVVPTDDHFSVQHRSDACGRRVFRDQAAQSPVSVKNSLPREGKKETPETGSPTNMYRAPFYDDFGGSFPGSPGFSPISYPQEISKPIDTELWRLMESGSQGECISLIKEKGIGAIRNIELFLDAAQEKEFFNLSALLQPSLQPSFLPTPSPLEPFLADVQLGSCALAAADIPVPFPTFDGPAEVQAEAPSIEEQLKAAFALEDEERALQILGQFKRGEKIPRADEFLCLAANREWWWAVRQFAYHVSERFNDENAVVLCILSDSAEIIETILQRSKAVRVAALSYLAQITTLGIDSPKISALFLQYQQEERTPGSDWFDEIRFHSPDVSPLTPLYSKGFKARRETGKPSPLASLDSPLPGTSLKIESDSFIEGELSNVLYFGTEAQFLQVFAQAKIGERIPMADELFCQVVEKEWFEAAQLLADYVTKAFNDENAITECILADQVDVISTILKRSKAVSKEASKYLVKLRELGISSPEINNLFMGCFSSI